jgi:serine/threonine protein kinase
MAPEQYESIHEGYSPEQADIWAVGCCLLNLVFSRNPFKVPSTSDPIFADYLRDPMSLCDVFPTMSTDTFDVLKHALAVDPAKRDLEKVRLAILDVENWTDSETAEDDEPENVQTDFTCYADEPITCTVFNRAPLRTPSLAQSQPFFTTSTDGTPFPWASALQHPVSTITKIDESDGEEDADAEYDSDVVCPKEHHDDGRSSDSGLGTSLGSLSITPNVNLQFPRGKFNSAFLPTPPNSNQKLAHTRGRPVQSIAARRIDVTKTTSSSVPITSGRGILGKYIQESSDKLKFGKSWSDWVEEEEDEAEELSRGDSRGSSGSSRSSFGETNEEEWWEGIPTAQWED